LFAWVRNLVPYIVGGTQTEGVRDNGAEEDILGLRGNTGVERVT